MIILNYIDEDQCRVYIILWCFGATASILSTPFLCNLLDHVCAWLLASNFKRRGLCYQCHNREAVCLSFISHHTVSVHMNSNYVFKFYLGGEKLHKTINSLTVNLTKLHLF